MTPASMELKSERVAETTVLRSLASLGVTVGRAKAGLSLPELGNQLMATDDRIAWAGLSLDGVVLKVEIVETVAVPEPEARNSVAAPMASWGYSKPRTRYLPPAIWHRCPMSTPVA